MNEPYGLFEEVAPTRTEQVVLVVQRFGVGLVIERSLVRLPAGRSQVN